MVDFLETYCRPGPLSDVGMRVRQVLDVEESVWAPVFGLKGQVRDEKIKGTQQLEKTNCRSTRGKNKTLSLFPKHTPHALHRWMPR